MNNLNSKIDFLVLGGTGMQGRIVVRDLLEKNYRVFISSYNKDDLDKMQQKYPALDAKALDLRNFSETVQLIKDVNPTVVVNCAEGDWNVSVYKAALQAGVHVIDLGSDIPPTKEQLAMDKKFRAQGLIAITGCGSTPGVNNTMLSYAVDQLDSVHTIEAGFAWNSNMKTFVVPFSMESILEEFIQDAPVVENGKWDKKVPMTTLAKKSFREIGYQQCFLVRHSEPYTFNYYYKNKGVKNIRFYAGFPEHSFKVIASLMPDEKVIARWASSQIPDNRTVFVDGKGEVPLDHLTKVMQELHKPPQGYKEKENLWVLVHGSKHGEPAEIIMECIVPTLSGWEDAGCNIDTGFPASIIAQMIYNGAITQAGSFAPEHIVPRREFFKALEERNMIIYMNGQKLDLDSVTPNENSNLIHLATT